MNNVAFKVNRARFLFSFCDSLFTISDHVRKLESRIAYVYNEAECRQNWVSNSKNSKMCISWIVQARRYILRSKITSNTNIEASNNFEIVLTEAVFSLKSTE